MTRTELESLLLKAPDYFRYYISLVEEGEPIVEYLLRQGNHFSEWANAVSEFAWDFRYAEGKWSMKEVLGHMIDTERIMCYRALCFARLEMQALPGFEEDEYVVAAQFGERSVDSLIEEFRSVRNSTISLFGNLNLRDWHREGIANGKELTVASIAFIIAGHTRHHQDVMKERYLGEGNPL